MATHVIGDPDTVVRGLSLLQERTAADEIMISTRLHSLEATNRIARACRQGVEDRELGALFGAALFEHEVASHEAELCAVVHRESAEGR